AAANAFDIDAELACRIEDRRADRKMPALARRHEQDQRITDVYAHFTTLPKKPCLGLIDCSRIARKIGSLARQKCRNCFSPPCWVPFSWSVYSGDRGSGIRNTSRPPSPDRSPAR